jgi:hypothetical protein
VELKSGLTVEGLAIFEYRYVFGLPSRRKKQPPIAAQQPTSVLDRARRQLPDTQKGSPHGGLSGDFLEASYRG